MLAGWFKMRVWLSKAPEVISIADAVGKSPQYVVGALSDVWSWANQYGKSGLIPKTSEVHVNKIAECEGFAEAMVAVGWLVIDEDGVTIPKFGDYHYLPKENVSPSAKSSSAERVRRYRARKKAEAAKSAPKSRCNGNGQIEIEIESNNNPPLDTPPNGTGDGADNGDGRTETSAGKAHDGLAGSDAAKDAAAETGNSDTGTDRATPGGNPRKSAKRGTRIADDFWPDDAGQQTFRECGGTDIVKAVDHFRDYWTACAGNKGTKLDWPATWRNWCRSAAERDYGSPGFGKPHGARSGYSEPGLANLFAAASGGGDGRG